MRYASNYHRQPRTGGVYIAVLGTALVVSVLGMSALMLQRLQNRHLTSTADMRQAQLNAEAAVDLALYTMKQDANWRTTQPHGSWFVNRGTGAGTCSLDVIDPADANLADDASEPVVVTGIGSSGRASQRIKLTVDSQKSPLGCLRSAVAAGDVIDMQGDILRATGLITANQVTASSANIYGEVKAVSISGSTYAGTTTQVSLSQLPTMPNWQTVFNYYRTNGTEIRLGDANPPPTTTPNLGRNTGIETGTTDWTGSPPYSILGNSTITQSGAFKRNGSSSLRVQFRDFWFSGPSQSIDTFVKPGVQYNVEAWVYLPAGLSRNFHISLYTKGSGSANPSLDTGPSTTVPLGVANIGWTRVSGTLTAQSWSGNLEYAFIKVAGADSNNTGEFYVDDLDIRENVTGRFIYRKVLSPNNNPFNTGQTNAQGIYWIDCGGQRLIIERSRILGTLLVVNPGAGSCVSDGPISWSPAVAGYPALLVDADTPTEADFSIRFTSRGLSEKENSMNFNPTGSPHSELGQDSDSIDIYRSDIQGLIVVEDDLTFQNTPLIRGQVIAGDDISNSSGTFDVDYQPDSLLRPPPGFLDANNTYVPRPGSAAKAVLP